MANLPVVVCLVALLGLLVAENKRWLVGIWLTKPVAAASYVWLALARGALQGPFGRWLVAALILCWWGDVLLIPKDRRRWFQAGVLAFLAGHLAFIVAFLSLPKGPNGLVVGTLLAVVLAWSVSVWLGPKLSRGIRRLVQSYVVVICCMLVAAFAAADGSEVPRIALGATLFALSDISVARDRFVTPGFVNRAWGLPLYFVAQLLLASTGAL